VIRRRTLLIAIPMGFPLGGVLARPPVPGQAPKVIGLLFPWNADDVAENSGLFAAAMGQIGYAKETNFTLVTRTSDGHEERLDALAQELVERQVDLIFAASTVAASAAKRATGTLPIVFMYVTDPVGAGFAESLARPGHNMTGLANLTLNLDGKRLELLKRMVPGLVRVAYLVNPKSPLAPSVLRIKDLAGPLGLHTSISNASSRDELEGAFNDMRTQRAQAVMVMSDSYLFSLRKEISALALRDRLPSMWSFADCVEAGGLMSYGADDSGAEMRQVAGYVDKIFNGAKPGDLAIQQPSKFDLVINGRTADVLGIKIPRQLRLQAEKVVD
jgi:putative tryptophan/tyrosine transport system substrate-binding protein